MTDLEDGDNEILILNQVQDAVLPLADPKQIVTRELLATRGPGLTGEPPHPATTRLRSAVGSPSISWAADGLISSL